MREYEEVGINIQALTEFIKTNTVTVNEIKENIEKLKEKWLKPLKQLVEKINENFSSYFSAMDCAGEVTLTHGENVVSIHDIQKNKKHFFIILIYKYIFRWILINMV